MPINYIVGIKIRKERKNIEQLLDRYGGGYYAFIILFYLHKCFASKDYCSSHITDLGC